jgi:hypothetical protein
MTTFSLDLAHSSSVVCMYGYTSSCAYEELGRVGVGGGEGGRENLDCRSHISGHFNWMDCIFIMVPAGVIKLDSLPSLNCL